MTDAHDKNAAATLKAVPTTKVLAIGTLSGELTLAKRKEIMPQEVADTLHLYLDGKIDQWWSRQDMKGVLFLMSMTTVEAAQEALGKLPLVEAGFLHFDYMALGPLRPLNLLLGDFPKAQG